MLKMKLAITLMLLFAAVFFEKGNSSGHEAPSEFEVSITVNYTPPLTFDRQPPYYRAGSPISLTCGVEGVSGDGVFYEWRSTCVGNCFAARQTTNTVKTLYLHSYDSGVHTCIVYDGLGCSGNSSVTVTVVGAGFHVSAGQKTLPNNSLIVAGADNRISEFRCLSGSSSPDVGQLINSQNEDITHDDSDSFLVRKGGRYDPGLVHVRRIVPLASEEQGVYTCRIPDEGGVTVDVNVGLYLKDSAVPPSIVKMEYDVNVEGLYIVTCTTAGSPPTSVTWTRNSDIISKNDSMYKSTVMLVDRNNTIYQNLLTIGGSFEDAVGEYSCMVENSLGASDIVNKTIKAIEISGHDTPVIVGLSGSINCTTSLNVSKMEWYIKGFDDPVESGTRVNSLVLTLTPESTALNGTSVVCKAFATSGEVYEGKVTIIVKELENNVRLEGPDNPLLAGGDYAITCVVTADVLPEVKWRDGEGNDIPYEEESGGGVYVDKEKITGRTTRLKLRFPSLLTSQGGTYSCLSIIIAPSSIQVGARDVIAKIPPPVVRIVHQPERPQLFTTDSLDLICLSNVNLAVDVPVSVSMTWLGPSGTAVRNDSRVHVLGTEGAMLEFDSSIRFSSLRSTDSGSYTCSSAAVPSQTSRYIINSDVKSTATSVNAALKTEIIVSYTPPDQYPDYAPPNYRAASSVTLRCTTEGASGSVSYRWSSTCRSCFASGSTSPRITESILRSRDSGVHTCTATDSVGNIGNSSTTMNIVGAGVYVTRSVSHGGRQSAQPNDTYIVVDTGNNRYSDYIRLKLYCCSNATYSNVGSFTFPDGSTRSRNYDDFRITRYSSSSAYAGCIFMDIYYYNHCSGWYCNPDIYFSLASSQKGVYTCNIPDASGHTQNVNFALYSEGSYRISVQQLRPTASTSAPTLSCLTSSIPPTEVSWQKDGLAMAVNDSKTEMTKYITSRLSSSYSVSLSLYTDIENVTGGYTCTVGNRYSTRTSQTHSIRGIETNLTSTRLIIGSYVKFKCSSDLDPQSIIWYRNGSNTSSVSGSGTYKEIAMDPVSTDDEGMSYSCSVVSPYGSQQRNKTLRTLVPDNWAAVTAWTSVSAFPWYYDPGPFHGSNYTITCTVHIIKGMNLPPVIQWYHSNGSLLENGHRITITSAQPRTTNNGTTRVVSLTFAPILSEDGGEYSCRAQVFVPWMTEQPRVHSSSVDVVVTTQAKFQLKFGPLPHCTSWELETANNLQRSIKREIQAAIRDRCDCNFYSYAIESGEFSCQTTTTNVVYRAIINGKSNLRTADELLEYLDHWRKNDQTLLHDLFRLRMSQDCPLKIDSFNEVECKNNDKNNNDMEHESSKKEGLLLDSGSCYRFQACDQDQEHDGSASGGSG